MQLRRALLPPLLALGLTMCAGTGVDPICACPPAVTTAVIYGRVTAQSGAPAAARPVDVEIYQGPCEAGLGARQNVGQQRASTDADGRFRVLVLSPYAPATACGEAAVVVGADTVARARGNVALRMATAGDSLRLDLVLP